MCIGGSECLMAPSVGMYGMDLMCMGGHPRHELGIQLYADLIAWCVCACHVCVYVKVCKCV